MALDPILDATEKAILKSMDELQKKIEKLVIEIRINPDDELKRKLNQATDIQAEVFKEMQASMQDVIKDMDFAAIEKEAFVMLKDAGLKDYSGIDKVALNALKEQISQGVSYLGEQNAVAISQDFYNYVLLGTSKTELIKQIAGRITGEGADGRPLALHAKTYAQDMQMEYYSKINLLASDDVDKFKYYGNVMNTTRDKCRNTVGKTLTRKEIEQWGKGSWKGKKAGDPFIVRGGWNCRHTWQPVIE